MMINTIKKITFALRKSLFLSLLFCTSVHVSFGASSTTLQNELFPTLPVNVYQECSILNDDGSLGYKYAKNSGSTHYGTDAMPEALKELVTYFELNSNSHYNNGNHMLTSAKNLNNFIRDSAKKDYFEPLDKYNVTDPELLIPTSDDKADLTERKIEDWAKIKTNIKNIREAINEIQRTASYNEYYSPKQSTHKARYFAYVFKEKGLSVEDIKEVNSALKRIRQLIAKRKELDAKADKAKKDQRQKMKDDQIKARNDQKLEEIKNRARLEQARIQDEANQRRLAQDAANALAERQRLEREAQERLEADNENKEKNRQTDIAKTQLKWDNVKDVVKNTFDYLSSPKFASSVLGILAGGVFLYYTLKEIVKLIFQEKLKYTLYSYTPSKWPWSKRVQLPEVVGQPILNPEFEKQINTVTEAMIKILEMKTKKDPRGKNLLFTNLAFYGVGGVGKSMIAKLMLREVYKISKGKAAFYFIPASYLMQDKNSAVKEMKKIMDQIKRNRERGIITFVVWDEAETAFGPRGEGEDDLKGQILGIFLNHVSNVHHPYVCHIAITNGTLDPHAATRLESFEFPLPEGDTISKLLKMYLGIVSKKFHVKVDSTIYAPDNMDELKKILHERPPREIRAVIEKIVLDAVGSITVITSQALIKTSQEVINRQINAQRAAEKRFKKEAPSMVPVAS